MKEKKTVEFVWSVVVNLLVLAAVNTFPLWRHLTNGIVLPTWGKVLWAMNSTGGVTILGNLLLAYYRPPRLRFFFEMFFDAAAFVSTLVFYLVFPLDFSRIPGDWLNTLIKAFLIMGMCAAAIAFIVHFVRFLRGDRPAAAGERET